MNKKNISKIKVGLITLTLPGVMTSALAQESVITPFNGPRNTVSAGGTIVTKKSAKFGEYTGLNKSRVNAAFDLNGGNGLDLAGGTKLWNFSGTDLGTTSRALDASYGDQGKWKVGFGFDQLKHYISDSYQTPFIKNGNTFTLPTNFGSINGGAGATGGSAPAGAGTNNLNATQRAAFHNEEVATERKTTALNGTYIIAPNLEFAFGYSHLDQTGNKLLGTTAFVSEVNLPGTSVKSKSRANNIILNPTEYRTDNFNADITWFLEKGSLNLGYFGSIFNDKYNSVNWQNSISHLDASACVLTDCFWNNNMSTAPDNNFHQLSLAGSYRVAEKTKVSGNFSYGINKQKDAYMTTLVTQPNGVLTSDSMQANGLPVGSLGGKVRTVHGDLKAINNSIDKLTLATSVKFDERSNKTASRTYNFYYQANSGISAKTAASATNNTFSFNKIKADVSGDYRITNKQTARLFFERENVKRWCGSLTGAPCTPSEKENENTVGTNYRIKATENLNFNAGYTYAKRNAKINPEFVSSTGIAGGANKIGFVASPFGNRVRHLAKAGSTWQITDAIDLGVSGSYNRDSYSQVLGIQGAYSRAINLDVGYAYSDNLSFAAYSTLTKGKRGLRLAEGSAGSPNRQNVSNIFTNDLVDTGTSFGLMVEQKKLLNGKMDVSLDATYSLDKSHYTTTLFYTNTCSTSFICGDTNQIKSQLLTIKLNDTYSFNESNSIGLEYIYQRRISQDYFYNGLQYPYTYTTLMPTNEQAPTYTVNLVTVNYNYRF